MRRESLGWIVAAGVVLACIAGAAQKAEGPVGRYQLTGCKYVVTSVNEGADPITTESHGVFLLDTANGRVWNLSLVATFPKGEPRIDTKWDEIPPPSGK